VTYVFIQNGAPWRKVAAFEGWKGFITLSFGYDMFRTTQVAEDDMKRQKKRAMIPSLTSESTVLLETEYGVLY
jgi:hypothetical protein